MGRKAYRTRIANGQGSVRKKTITRKGGKKYEIWEARYTIGYDDNGKQVQKTVTAKTQAECVQKLNDLIAEYGAIQHKPVISGNVLVKDWLSTWKADYLNHVTSGTAFEYGRKIELYIIPAIGEIALNKLSNHDIQAMLNRMIESKNRQGKPLSPKTIKDAYGVLHKALAQAVAIGLLRRNPAENCSLPKQKKPSLTHFETEHLKAFLEAIRGHCHENYYKTLLFTGMREAEGLGLTWDCINFERNTIEINKQLQRNRKTGEYEFVPPKDDEYRVIVAPSALMGVLKQQRQAESTKARQCKELWEDHNLVFSNPVGSFLSYRTVYDCYKRIVKGIGIPTVRVHELRHAYCALALENGDDIKTVQRNLGHATPDFTLKVYAYSSMDMQQNSADKMSRRMAALAGNQG